MNLSPLRDRRGLVALAILMSGMLVGCGEETSQSPAPPPAAAAPPPAEKAKGANAKNQGSSAARDSTLNGASS